MQYAMSECLKESGQPAHAHVVHVHVDVVRSHLFQARTGKAPKLCFLRMPEKTGSVDSAKMLVEQKDQPVGVWRHDFAETLDARSGLQQLLSETVTKRRRGRSEQTIGRHKRCA